MRDYCARQGLAYLLAATEYSMPGSTMVLDSVVADLDRLEGLVVYSVGLLPHDRAKRLALYRRIVDSGATLHVAVEGLVVRSWDDARRLEESWIVYDVLAGQDQDLVARLAAWDLGHAGD